MINCGKIIICFLCSRLIFKLIKLFMYYSYDSLFHVNLPLFFPQNLNYELKIYSENFTCVLPLSSEARAEIYHILMFHVLSSLVFIYFSIHKYTMLCVIHS